MMIRFGFAVCILALWINAAFSFDIVIQNGLVFDGSDKDAIQTDIGLEGDRIAKVGVIEDTGNALVIDASGLMVAPGFIDPHTHLTEALSDPKRSDIIHYLMQGVTTVVVGNDGGGTYRVNELQSSWKENGIGVNAALLTGQGMVRRRVMGMSGRVPTDVELEEMKALVRRGMQEGAFGLSSGLFYTPGSYAKTEEVIELAKIAAEFGGYYDTHTRDESSYTIGLLDSVREAIEIGRKAKIPVHISHIKALGVDVWGKSKDVVDIIRQAQREGIRVTADQYSYIASNTGLGAALVPRWALVDGNAAFLERLNDPATKQRILDGMKDNLRRRGGPQSLLLINPNHDDIHRRYLGDVAKTWKMNPIDAALKILTEKGGASVISFNMNEDDIDYFMKQDFVVTGSDGSGNPSHPRSFGTFPRKIKHYAMERGVIDLPTAIHSCTGRTADAIGIPGRGYIKEGFFADIVIFDPNTIQDRATFEDPGQLAEGVRYLFVNGQAAIREGQFTGIRAGRPLKRTSS